VKQPHPIHPAQERLRQPQPQASIAAGSRTAAPRRPRAGEGLAGANRVPAQVTGDDALPEICISGSPSSPGDRPEQPGRAHTSERRAAAGRDRTRCSTRGALLPAPPQAEQPGGGRRRSRSGRVSPRLGEPVRAWRAQRNGRAPARRGGSRSGCPRTGRPPQRGSAQEQRPAIRGMAIEMEAFTSPPRGARRGLEEPPHAAVLPPDETHLLPPRTIGRVTRRPAGESAAPRG